MAVGTTTVPIKWSRELRFRAPRSSASESILDALNDDCLLGVLGRAALSVRDLLTIGRTSKHLYALVGRTIKQRLGRKTVHLATHEWPLPACELLFRDYGQHITSIALNDNVIYMDIMLGFIARHCPNLAKLSTSRMTAMAQAIAQYEQLPAERRAKVAAPFAKLHELDYLGLPLVYAEEILPAIRLPSLRRLTLNAAAFDAAPFLAQNNKLTALGLKRTIFRAHIKHMFGLLPDLAELEVDYVLWNFDNMKRPDYDVDCFGELAQLQRFTYHPFYPDYTRGILAAMHAGNVPVKFLALHTEQYPEALLQQMTGVEEVRMFALDSNGIRAMVEHVEADKQLRFVSSGVADGWFGFKRVVQLPTAD